MKPNEIELKKGMVVQLSPDVGNKALACCMMVISEPKGFGAHGYVQNLGERGAPGGQAYYRVNWHEMEYIGQSVWDVE